MRSCPGGPGFARRRGQADLGSQALVFGQKRPHRRSGANKHGLMDSDVFTLEAVTRRQRRSQQQPVRSFRSWCRRRCVHGSEIGFNATKSDRNALAVVDRTIQTLPLCFDCCRTAPRLDAPAQQAAHRAQARGRRGGASIREYGTARRLSQKPDSPARPLAVRQLRDFNAGRIGPAWCMG